ncbi:MAG: endonuclease III [Myxococcales bacterium]|nr:endonuclease III [Myxococcales bacterium]
MAASADAPDIDVLLSRLHETHPNARYELDWENPLQLLVATILAAQCTDERVNRVTKTLFVTYPDAAAFADADRGELEEALKPTGFFRQKAKKVQEVCQAVVARFGGAVPETMEELVSLPGIARKSANVVLNTAFDMPSGIIVDTHVQRVAPRMGLTRETKKPERIERDLMAIIPESEWTFFGPAMVLHGRYTCTARAPKCDDCVMADICPKIGV